MSENVHTLADAIAGPITRTVAGVSKAQADQQAIFLAMLVETGVISPDDVERLYFRRMRDVIDELARLGAATPTDDDPTAPQRDAQEASALEAAMSHARFRYDFLRSR